MAYSRIVLSNPALRTPHTILQVPFALLCTLLLTLPAPGQAQSGVVALPAPAPEEVCSFEAVLQDAGYALPARRTFGSSPAKSATFEINYVNDDLSDPWPEEAKTAFDFAASIWESHIASNIPIEINAIWKDFGGCNLASGTTLGTAGPVFLVQLALQGQTDALYPIAMANSVTDQDLIPGEADIKANFNKDCDNMSTDFWYFGIDASPPQGKIDFASVVLHELGHGLGFFGSASYDDGAEEAECNGVSGFGCFNDTPYTYDLSVFDAPENGVSLLNTTAYPNPSKALGDQFTGLSEAGIFFSGTSTDFANVDAGAKLYTPSTWQAGSSYSHLDEDTFNGSDNALMTPMIQTNEAIHQPAAITCGIMGDMGWPLGPDCEVLLPVSLTSFDALQEGRLITLIWETAGELNNAGFEIQHNESSHGEWRHIGFVAGNGTTDVAQHYRFNVQNLLPGSHSFRLKQIDFDGGFFYSPTITVTVEAEVPFSWSAVYPNPFNPQTTFTFSTAKAQHVEIEAVDALGRYVESVFSGWVPAQSSTRVLVDASHFSSGVYWLRARGASFQETQKMIVLN